MRFLGFSVSGGYWYRMGYALPEGASDKYAEDFPGLLRIVNVEGIAPSQDDVSWLEGAKTLRELIFDIVHFSKTVVEIVELSDDEFEECLNLVWIQGIWYQMSKSCVGNDAQCWYYGGKNKNELRVIYTEFTQDIFPENIDDVLSW